MNNLVSFKWRAMARVSRMPLFAQGFVILAVIYALLAWSFTPFGLYVETFGDPFRSVLPFYLGPFGVGAAWFLARTIRSVDNGFFLKREGLSVLGLHWTRIQTLAWFWTWALEKLKLRERRSAADLPKTARVLVQPSNNHACPIHA